MAITEGTRELIRNELWDLVEDFDSDSDGPPPLAHSESSGVDDVPGLSEDEDPWADGDPGRKGVPNFSEGMRQAPPKLGRP